MSSPRPLLIASALALTCAAGLHAVDSRPSAPHAAEAATVISAYAEAALPHPARHRVPPLAVSRVRAVVAATRPATAPRPVAAPRPAAATPAARPVRPAPAPVAVARPAAPRPPVVIQVRHEASQPAPAVRHVVTQQAELTPRPIAKRHPRPPAPAPAPRPTSGRDDYPYASSSGNANDRWGFTERQCTSFVAWRLAQAGSPLDNANRTWGDASHWDDTARRQGRGVTTTPAVGTVAQWGAGERSPYYAPGSSTASGSFVAGGLGHVALVRAVYSDGSVLVEQYNLFENRSYSQMRVKAPRYLHLG